MAGVGTIPADSTVAPAARRPAARVAAIQAEDDLGLVRLALQRVGQGQADGVDGDGIERGFAGDGANAVCAEELAGCSCGHSLNS